MAAHNPQNSRLRVAHLNPRTANDFDLQPDDDRRAALAGELQLLELPVLRFRGTLRAEGADGWALHGQLTARVVQPCVITLAPVETTIDETVARSYSPHLRAVEGDEIEMPDDEIEPLGQFIDLDEVMVEALALALPLYPHAEGAQLDDLPQSQTGDADGEDRQKPFAGLAALLGGKAKPDA